MNNIVLEFECIGMNNGCKFPSEYTGRGQNISPEFVIKNLSPNAKTLAVTLEDLSYPIKDFTHWIIRNIPAAGRIRENIPAGKTVPTLGNARQGIGYGLHRYAGPKPLFYAVLGIPVDMPVFNGSDSDTLAVMP